MKKPLKRVIRTHCVDVTSALDLYLTENRELLAKLNWHNCDQTGETPLSGHAYRWARQVAFTEGLLALVEYMKEHPDDDMPVRFEAVPGPRRLCEYEKEIRAVEEGLKLLTE